MLLNGYKIISSGWDWLIMIGVLILIVLGIFALIHYLRHPVQKNESFLVQKTALHILDERYAKGEISDDEYRSRKSELGK